ncbi:hypothetical protein [Moritella sp. JT01]|nr:hypothetical protein [Moritella sp. JT01]
MQPSILLAPFWFIAKYEALGLTQRHQLTIEGQLVRQLAHAT